MNDVGRRTIDWKAVRARVRGSAASLEDTAPADLLSFEKLLRRRAQTLARRGLEKDNRDTLDVLTFRLAGERFGVELSELSEVLRLPRMTPVPGAPSELLGVINLRGEIRPVVHLGILLDLPPADESASYALFVRRRAVEVGLAVQETEAVRTVSASEVTPPVEDGSSLTTHYVKGMLPGMLPLLSIDAVLSHPVFKEAIDP